MLAFQGEEHQPFRMEAGNCAALLIHGFPGSPAEMRPAAEILHQAGWTAQGLLLPGFGAQVETLADRTHDEWLDHVQENYDTLRRDYQRVILVGNSMGGALAIEIAARSTRPPDGLILFAPFWKIEHVAWRALPVIQLMFPKPRIFKWLNLDFQNPEVREGIHNFMPGADLDDPQVQQEILDFPVPVRMFAQIYKAGKNAHRLAEKIRIPTLVIQGAQDQLVQPGNTRKLISRFQAPVYYHEVQAEHNTIDPGLPEWDMISTVIQTFIETRL